LFLFRLGDRWRCLKGWGARFEKKCPVSVAFKGGVRSGQLLLVGPKSGRVITTIQKCEKAASVGDIVILATDFLVYADVHYAFPFGAVPMHVSVTAPTARAEPAGEPSDCCRGVKRLRTVLSRRDYRRDPQGAVPATTSTKNHDVDWRPPSGMLF
jgi:hypothetical protein